MKEDGPKNPILKGEAITSVSGAILGEFFDAMRDDAYLADIEPTLRRIVLEDGVFAEPAIRAALFPNAS